ncbi:hypothetical protein [Shinella sp. DD12]|uniref:hypothetical protein n=1 Tax=Shinella sp. DD12 TaxID=1410620 RepID=UPI0003C566A9|nr:hypothetical protein [Shinella sp. DD12]EYR77651.1 hypothetical protein SHLA_65c000040 [Shinella sp. DD12]
MCHLSIDGAIFQNKGLVAVIEERAIVDVNGRNEERSPLFRLLRYLARALVALQVAVARGIFFCVWCLAYSVLSLLRPVVDVLMLGGLIMPLVAFVAFVKPEAANGIPFWVFLLMAVGFVSVALGYSKFVDLIAPPR